MKKLFTLALVLMGFACVSNAATIDDLAVCKHSYVLVGDNYTNNGTEKIAKNTLYGDGYFFTPTGHDKATNKGTVDLSVADGVLVTEEIAAKYSEYGAHLNSLRLKTTQDQVVMKVTAKSKLIIFYNNNNADRYPVFAKDDKQSATWEPDFKSETVDGKSARIEWTAPDDVTVYIGANNQIFISYIIVEANEAPGTPQVKIGDQTFEGGLWFREVTAKAVEAEGFPTIVTYTTDGSAPTAASPVYTAPIKCYNNMTVKFQAFMDLGTGAADEAAKLDGADNEAPVSFAFDAPTINADGANVTISTPYAQQNGSNFYKIGDADAVKGDAFTLTESATVTAYTEIANGSYGTFLSKNSTKDVYVLNPIKSKKIIAVTAGEVVLDEEATETSTTGPVYTVENGAISADKMDFFVKNLEFAVVTNEDYQVDGETRYIKMNNTNITFMVADGDSVTVKVICSKNSCKNIDADDNADDPTALVNDRKCIVNVSGTNYFHTDAEGNEASDMKLCEDANIIEFGLNGGTYTFQKYSGTGNILIKSIEITPATAEPETLDLIDRFTNCWNGSETNTHNDDGTVTYNAVQWGGLAAWIGGEDWSEYEKIVFEFAEPTTFATQIYLQYADGTETKAWINDGAATAECTLEAGKVAVNQAALQCAEAGTLTITKIYLVKAAAGISNVQTVAPVRSGAIYNLAGQKVDANYRGVVIVNGKKMLQK